MKRLAAILLLLLFLFNVGGYYLVFLGLQYSSSEDLYARFGRGDVAKDDLVHIKVELNLPYPIHQGENVPVDVALNFDGQSLLVAQQKLENDTLYLVGLRNHHGAKLNAAFDNFAKSTSGSPTLPGTRLLSKLIKEYCEDYSLLLVTGKGWQRDLRPPLFTASVLRPHVERFTPPPDAIG